MAGPALTAATPLDDQAAAGRPVLCFGEALIDLIVADGAPSLEAATTFVARPGGAPANSAVAIARLGLPSGFVGVVGGDPFGDRLMAELARGGVDVSRLRRAAGSPTTLAFAWKDERNDGHFWLLRGADTLLSAEDVDGAGVAAAAAIVVGSVALSAEPSRSAIYRAVATAADAGVPVCVDVNLRPSIWPDLAAAGEACEPIIARAALLKLSVDDARGLVDADEPGVVFQRLSHGRDRVVVLTDGARGAWFAGEEGFPVHVPAVAVDAVEPTGAGDAFTAALLSRLLASGWRRPTRRDVEYAAAAGAIATTRPGAWEGLPSRQELDRFVAERFA